MYHSTSGKKILLLLLSLFLTACASTSKQPQWLDGESLQYPREQYLSAVGEANTREAAGNRARANLSQIFQVAINDTGLDFSQAIVTNTGGLQRAENTLQASRSVSAEAHQVLEGTQTVQYWVDPTGKVYSLVVLEKAPANRRFRDSIHNADRKTADLVAYANQKAKNPVAALRALESARLIQVQRDNTNRNLAVVAGKGIIAHFSTGQLESTIRQALASLQFALASENAQIRGDVENAVASLGIEHNPRSAYRLTSKLDTEPVQKRQGWFWLRGAVQLSLDLDGETIARQRWPIKVSAVEQGMVIQRLNDMLSDKLTTYLYQMLTAVNDK